MPASAQNTQIYPGLGLIDDPKVRSVVVALWERINALQGREFDLSLLRANLDGGAHRLTNVGDPAAAQDAVTKAYADAHYGPQVIRQALQVGGAAPLSITNLLGSTPVSLLLGTHAERLNTPTIDSALFYETDRQSFYRASAGAWIFAFGSYLGTTDAAKPSDLGSGDDGFLYSAVTTSGLVWRWSGAAWHVLAGIIQDTFGNRPAVASVDGGVIFEATDYGNQAWIPNFVGAWVLLEGWGGPLRGTISPDQKPGGLGAGDVGFRFFATDYNREYRWTGAGWADGPGAESRFQYVNFDVNVPDTNGWILANGIAQTRSTAGGGTAAFTPANIANNYVRV